MLAMWINSHQVAYFGGISTTFPTLLEMLTQSNLSFIVHKVLTPHQNIIMYKTHGTKKKEKSLSRKDLP
jgi:hypothetical protein